MSVDELSHDRKVRVLVIDDHSLVRDALVRLLERDGAFDVIGAVGTATEALEIAMAVAFDLALVDVVLSQIGGVNLTKRLKDAMPGCRVVGISAHDDVRRVAAMLRAGADGFVSKSQEPVEIASAIRSVASGVRYLPPAFDAREVDQLVASEELSPLERLTHREREVYELIVDGRSNEQVASALLIARRTVETHRQHIMRKLGASSVAELVHLAYRARL